MSKQYGLIKPGNVFGSSDSEDETINPAKIKTQPLQNILQKRQLEKIHEQAIQEDSSVFLYDEVYDDIQEKRNEIKIQKKSEDAKKPKYIKKLIETAEKRKKDFERRIERQVQKERMEEGERFKDKESFVTSTYRLKLEEMKQAELIEKRQEYLESIGDVTKQPDISGFYRHIYSQKLGSEDVKNQNKEVEETPIIKSSEAKHRKKNFRKRENSNNDDELDEVKSELKTDKKEHLNSNIDADSDFSVDSLSEPDSSRDINEKIDKTVLNSIPSPVVSKDNMEKSLNEPIFDKKEDKELKEFKPKVNIWAKRTVDEVFLEAVKRFYERKAMRENLNV